MQDSAPVGIQNDLHDASTGKLGKYAGLVVGKKGLGALFKYEFVQMFSTSVPGALGLLLRSKMYKWLLGSCGRNVNFGMNVVLRHPHKIHIGDNVVIDDNCLLDAKGTDNNGITIGAGSFIGRNTILSCKNGDIEIGENANIGFNCEIFSASKVILGRNNLYAAYCYLIGGEHTYERTDVPVLEQERVSRGIRVEDNVWLGASVKINDGVTVGRDAIIGTSAVVRDDIPEFSIAVGIPAKVVKSRK